MLSPLWSPWQNGFLKLLGRPLKNWNDPTLSSVGQTIRKNNANNSEVFKEKNGQAEIFILEELMPFPDEPATSKHFFHSKYHLKIKAINAINA